jgi:hypothetical protein
MRLWWLCTTAANIAWESCPREPRYTERTGVWRLDRLANRSFGRRVLPRQISNFPLCLAVAFPESPSRARHRSPLARMLFSALWSNPALRPMDQTARAESMHACLRLIQHQRQISSWVAPSCLIASAVQTSKLQNSNPFSRPCLRLWYATESRHLLLSATACYSFVKKRLS